MKPAQAVTVTLRALSAGYGALPVLHTISLDVAGGELVAILGPSGCGKSTLLKVIAGLHPPSSGEVLFNERVVTALAPERRRAPMVFQKALLFPHMTVEENVGFSLKLRGTPRREAERQVAEALELVRLGTLGKRLPRELSGGQEQRVSLARAIVSEPQVLLLDEPFSALDESLRGELRLLVRDLQRRLGLTTLFVTHDQREAATMANRIALVLDGRLAQVGAVRDFYTAPASVETAQFFGWQMLRQQNGSWLAFRPEQARVLAPGSDSPGEGWVVLPATLVDWTDLGRHRLARLRLPGGEVLEVEDAPGGLAAGLPVALALDRRRCREFPAVR